MKQKSQLIVLVVLVAVLGSALYYYFGPTDNTPASTQAIAQFVPVNVDNPALRTDLLKRFLELEYKGTHRNIFSATLPTPPAPPVDPHPVPIAPPTPTGPAPLVVNYKYFGYVSDGYGAHQRGMFSMNNDEDVVIGGEGETLEGRYRILKITNTVADVEEVSSGRRATLTLEDPRPNG
jgi:hypothetical protein